MIGKTVSHYKIIEKLGEGGMGVVYKAQDTKLKRTVALKFLAPELTRDEQIKERFTQEAIAASALQHHNICNIHGIDTTEDGQMFICMDYYKGETLKEKIESGPLKLKDVIDIAMQTAEGLSKAHESGIVHRDIKPGNIMVTDDGVVKIVDFGLAKLAGQTKLTKASTTIGTVAYMSPEQTQGEEIDSCTDIWSLGVVLYEMITGKLPFRGEYEQAMMFSIINEDPEPITGLRTGVPLELEQIVDKALEKKPEDRYQYVKDTFVDLKRVKRDSEKVSRRSITAISEARAVEQKETKVKIQMGNKFLVPLIVVVAMAILALGVLLLKPFSQRQVPLLESTPFTSLPGQEWAPAFSPNGQEIAYFWNGESRDNWDIYVQGIVSTVYQRMTDDPGGDAVPVWSPDGNFIAFMRGHEGEVSVIRMPSRVGPETSLLTRGENLIQWGLSWSPDDQYLALSLRESPEEPYRIVLFDVDTRNTTTLTNPPDTLVGDYNPVFSPDGKMVAYLRSRRGFDEEIYTIPVTGVEERPIMKKKGNVGNLAWTSDSREIVFSMSPWKTLWRISATGGKARGLGLQGTSDDIRQVAISPGGKLAYVNQKYNSGQDIFRVGIPGLKNEQEKPEKFIFTTRNENGARYNPDGTSIVFYSNRSGKPQIYMCESDGKNERPLPSLEGQEASQPNWSTDGQQIAFTSSIGGIEQIYIMDKDGGNQRPLTQGNYRDTRPRWSRDDQWIYYQSFRTGESQIWKTSVEGDSTVQVTTDGGRLAMESADGKWIYFTKTLDYRSGLWKKPVKGGDEILALDVPVIENSWEVVVEGIYYIRHTDTGLNIEFYHFDSKETTIIGEFEGQTIQKPNVSPDRKWILFTKHDPMEADIMLVENFR